MYNVTELDNTLNNLDQTVTYAKTIVSMLEIRQQQLLNNLDDLFAKHKHLNDVDTVDIMTILGDLKPLMETKRMLTRFCVGNYRNYQDNKELNIQEIQDEIRRLIRHAKTQLELIT